MTARPAITFLDQARNEGELKTSFFGPMLDNAAEAPGRGAMTELTLDNNVAGSVTPAAQASRQVSVDTNADASSGELATIAQTNGEDGAWILLRNDTDGRDIVVIHGAGGSGQILLADSQDLTLDSTAKALLLRREGTTWVEIGRFLGAGSYARKQANVETLTAARTLTADDDGKLFLGDLSGGAFTFTLPFLADAPDGAEFAAMKSESSANALTLDGNDAETINGQTSIVLRNQYDFVKVRKEAGGWLIVSGPQIASQAEMEAATAPDKLVTPANLADAMNLETEIATTSGTGHNFIDIRASAKRITLMFDSVSTNGTALPVIRLGDSGGFETTGYSGTVSNLDGSPTLAGHSTGFLLAENIAVGTMLSGVLTLTLMDPANNTWALSGVLENNSGTTLFPNAGIKSLSGVLTQIRLTTVGGADAFDAGAFNIKVE